MALDNRDIISGLELIEDIERLKLEKQINEWEQVVLTAAIDWHQRASEDVDGTLEKNLHTVLESLITMREQLPEIEDSIMEEYCPELSQEDRIELAELQREMEQSSLGDKPQSIAAPKLKRLIDLETRVTHTRDIQPSPSNEKLLETTIKKYEAALRKIRDQSGDDRCWQDFEYLFSLLPEGYSPPKRDTFVELENCRKFIGSQHNPATVYVSPQREIERLRDGLIKIRDTHYVSLNTQAESATDDVQQAIRRRINELLNPE